MKHVVAHGLPDRARARVVIGHALDSYQERLADYRPSVQWNGDDSAQVSFEIMTRKLSATLRVDETNVVFEGKIPLLLKPFQTKVIDVLDREVHKWLDKAKNGEI